jgi:hypothetical protein
MEMPTTLLSVTKKAVYFRIAPNPGKDIKNKKIGAESPSCKTHLELLFTNTERMAHSIPSRSRFRPERPLLGQAKKWISHAHITLAKLQKPINIKAKVQGY